MGDDTEDAEVGQSDIQLNEVTGIVYTDENGVQRRRYWEGDELVDEVLI